MIEIKYNQKKKYVEILGVNEASAWIDIHRLCEEKSTELVNTSSHSLAIPSWKFVSIRGDLQHIFIKHKVRLSIDENIKDILQKAKLKDNLYKNIENIKQLSEEEIENRLRVAGFKRELKSFQLKNIAKLCSLPAGADFSVPGAGKTTEALACFYLMKTENSKLLIVAPKNAFPAWEEQIEICVTNPSKIIRLTGGYDSINNSLIQNPDIIMITYQQLPRVADLIGNYMSHNQFFMIVDESHRMKRGTNGTIGSTILSLSHLPDKKLILSGTPMPQDANDIIPQFNFLYPEISVDEETVIKAIKPIYVRTTKSQLGIGKPHITPKLVQMSPSQRKLYELLRSEAAREGEIILKAHDKNILRSMGRSVLRLIQLTSNPALLLKTDFQYHKLLHDVLIEGDSPKIEYVCNRARELANEGKKTIIWSGFVENVELVSLRLADLGADFIHGGVDSGDEDDSDTREAKVKRFNTVKDDAFVLVANPAAASEGISLHTVCHNAIYLDRNYNAAQFLQSMDRIHRIGLPKDVKTEIEIVLAPDSIDESVDRRLNSKINFMAEVLEDNDIKIEYEYFDEEISAEGINYTDLLDAAKYLLRKESD